MNNEHLETAKHVGDAVAGAVVIASLANILPPLSALIAIIYTLIRIYETKTVQRLLGKSID